MVALACDLELDFAPEMGDKKWDWLRQYCLASRVAYSIFDRKPFPLQFLKEVSERTTLLVFCIQTCVLFYLFNLSVQINGPV